jgi:hypothetical protein
VFNNLRENASKNLLSSEEAHQIWTPKLVFENTEDKIQTTMDDKTTVLVRTFNVSDFDISDKTNNEAVKQYAGEDNVLVMSKFYNLEFQCEFQMHWYPFDSQVCHADLGIVKDQEKFVHIQSELMQYNGPNDLTQYFIKGKRQVSIKRDNRGLVQIELVLGRRLLSLILTIFLPTLLMNIIGHCSNYFKPFFFEAVISLNVTVMLVLTTMFLNVSNNLPKTAYIKMVDIWLMFNLFKPFLDIIIQTYIETLRVEEEKEINHHGKTIVVSGKEASDASMEVESFHGSSVSIPG